MSHIHNIFQYLHDGSDTTTDNLRLVARTAGVDWPEKDKTSVAANLKILIQPVIRHSPRAMFWMDRLIESVAFQVNDAVPELVNNTGLTLWAGSTVPIR